MKKYISMISRCQFVKAAYPNDLLATSLTRSLFGLVFIFVSQSIFKGNKRSKGLLNLLKPSINFSSLNVVDDHDSGFVISNININKSGMCITITLTGMSLSQQLEATLITTVRLLLFGVGTLFGI